jgi:hypothetical protein
MATAMTTATLPYPVVTFHLRPHHQPIAKEDDMQLSQSTDLTTGRIFLEKETVVAVVIIPNPEIEKPQLQGMEPTEKPFALYQPISLPIFGKIGEFSSFIPTKGQLSLDLLLQFSGCKTWKSFENQALHYDKGFDYGFKTSKNKKSVVAGISYFSMDNYTSLCSQSRAEEDREGAVTNFTRMIADAAKRRSANPNDDNANSLLRWLNWSSPEWTTAEGDNIATPSLARLFENSDGSTRICGPLKSFISSHFEPLKNFKKGDASCRNLVMELFDGLYDYQALSEGLASANFIFAPSKTGTRGTPFLHAETTLDLLEGAVTAAMYGDHTSPSYRKQLEDLLADVQGLEDDLTAAAGAKPGLKG